MQTIGLSLGKYVFTARTSLMSTSAYIGDFLARSLLMIVFLFTFAQIWTKTLPGSGTVSGLSAANLVWYLAMTETVMLSMPRLEGNMVNDIKTGSISYLLGRPMDYIGYQFAAFGGETLLRVGVNGIVGAGAAWILVGPLHTSALALISWGISVTLGISLSFYMATCIALGSFWIEDVIPFFWIYNKLLFTLGGLFAPVGIYPGILKVIATWLPFNYVFAEPARLMVDFQLTHTFKCISLQLLWLGAVFTISRLIFAKGVKHVNVNGG